jgi:hypothetical protein
MGMFDYLNVEVELPDGTSGEGRGFQTKDLQSLMETYTITADGRLVRSRTDWEWIENSSSFFGGGLYPIPGSERTDDIPFHGDLTFYGDVKDGIFRNYVARFTEGKLSRMWYTDTPIPT